MGRRWDGEERSGARKTYTGRSGEGWVKRGGAKLPSLELIVISFDIWFMYYELLSRSFNFGLSIPLLSNKG